MAKHDLTVNAFTPASWENLIQESFQFSQVAPKLRGHVASLFLEPSTRTLLSFSLAAAKSGLTFHNLPGDQTSLAKGESLMDTCLNIEAAGITHLILRLKDEKILQECSLQLKTLSIICAGEGAASHPSQALLDACTIYEHHQSLSNMKILFLGDVEHSRVYRSNIAWMKWFNNDCYELSPLQGVIRCLKTEKIIDAKLDDFIETCDVLMLLRPQLERHQNPIELKNYHQHFGITLDRIKRLKNKCIILHPGPLYRDIEIASELLQHPKVKIFRQVHWGVPARMALYA